MDYVKHIADLIVSSELNHETIASSITESNEKDKADYTLPCFKFAKQLKKSPIQIAEALKSAVLPSEHIHEVSAVNGYLNFKLSSSCLAESVLNEIVDADCAYASDSAGNGKTICIDYSSINIAKPFHIGHLSTTVIGAALVRIFRHLGYRVVSINHLGDWGTQFGKLIVAYKRWGDRKTIEQGGVAEMLKIYVKFHQEAETHPELDDEARAWFKKIEDGDAEALSIFEWFKEITLKEVQRVYDMLGISFDSYAGESFYNDKMQSVLDKLTDKRLLEESEGAKVVNLDQFNMPPCLLVKADGATLYATRDLAAAFYRKETYDFYKCLYVVAYQQNLHFKQFFKVLDLMGMPWANDMVHVPFGMVSFEGTALSTRKGNVVFLEDVLQKCIEKAYGIINEKNPDLENKEQTAKAVGIGAVVFSALHASRIKDVSFSYDRVLNFDGETGPYVQYTYARCNSVLSKAAMTDRIGYDRITETEAALVRLLMGFKNVVKSAADNYEPSMVTRHIVDIAKAFNKFYYEERIIGSEESVRNFRLLLTRAAMIVIKTGMNLIGVNMPDKM